MSSRNLNIVIVGGGSAGWITALFCKKIFPTFNISLIESKDIGIVGVGEATTPNIVSLFKELKIDIFELLVECNGSIKNGISFDNWNGDNKRYFHSFAENISVFKLNNIFDYNCFDFYLKNLINKNLPLEDYVYTSSLAYNNKVDPDNTSVALHFDASLLANYLKKIALKKYVKHIDQDVIDFKMTERGTINQVQLKNGELVKCDFVFDCSGFHRLIVGKFFKEKWISYSKHLPMKKAIPFWLDNEEVIQPYTSAIAMKYGWMWKIPLQHRIGSGYIFDSDYINVDQALDEAQQYYKRDLDIRKIIPFEAGRFENLWVKNVMALGLSSSFIEPLESTSLFLTIEQLNTFRYFVNEIESLNEKSIQRFNTIVKKNMEEVLGFVYLHYVTKRKDSDFWKSFKEKYPPPEKIANLLEVFKSNDVRFCDLSQDSTASFALSSYLQVARGLELMENCNVFKQDEIYPSIEDYKSLIDYKVQKAVDVNTFIKGKTWLAFQKSI